MILTVLKFAGIILLFCLGFILLLLLALLFVPVRYSIRGSFHDSVPDGIAKAGWMFNLINVRAYYHKEEGIKAYISIACFKIFDLFDSGKEKADEEIDDDEDLLLMGESDSDSSDGSIYCAETAESPDRSEHISVADHPGFEKAPDQKKAVKSASACEKNKKPSILSRLADKADRTVQKIDDFFDRILKQIKETATALKAAYEDKSGKLKALYRLYKDERYAKDIALVKSRILANLKEIKPGKGHAEVRYGSEDPYSLGQIMQAAAFLYPFYNSWLEVIPDFDRDILDGQADIRGRVRMVIPAEACIRIYFNKNLRKLYRKARRILELD